MQLRFAALLLAWPVASLQAAEVPAFSKTAAKEPPAPWHVVGMPERLHKPVTQFELTDLDGQHVLQVKTAQSWGALALPWNETLKPSTMLRWRWRLDKPLAQSDIHNKATEDSALKVCVGFAMPLDNVPANERLLFKFTQNFSTEAIPTASICYIWGGKEPLGYEQRSLFINRLHFIVVANETSPLKTWLSKERNLYADFLKAFGQESSTVPALNAISIGADSDNTQGQSLGYVGDITLVPTVPQ